jgi:hypothetical protein
MKAFLAGFASLQPRCIHWKCPGCGRKMSNQHRESWDPPKAVVAMVPCTKWECQWADCYSSPLYYDADGHELQADE